MQELDPLKALEVPLSGTVLVGLDLDHGVETVGFNVTGTQGLINLPIEGHAPIEAESLAIRGLYNGGSSVIQIDHAEIDVKNATAITIPAPINHTFKLDAIRGIGRYGLIPKRSKLMNSRFPAGNITNFICKGGQGNGWQSQCFWQR